jgi:hypothetical protein
MRHEGTSEEHENRTRFTPPQQELLEDAELARSLRVIRKSLCTVCHPKFSGPARGARNAGTLHQRHRD